MTGFFILECNGPGFFYFCIMQLRHTIFLFSEETKSVLRIEIFTAENVARPGFWNIESNQLLLSYESYSYFRGLQSQREQKIFFESLKKVSSLAIA